MKLEAQGKARPGQEVEVALRLADDVGKPLAGEATFWMVDQAVLSLAKEQPLDPLPSFIVERATPRWRRATPATWRSASSRWRKRPAATRGLDEWGSDNNVSVRKNFTPVPIYLPSVAVGADGVAKIKVKLPDTLTVFKLRAKAISGPDRFGYATRRDADPSGAGRAAGLAAFRAAGRYVRGSGLSRALSKGRAAPAASISAQRVELAGRRRADVSPGRKTGRRVSTCAPACPSQEPGAADRCRLRFQLATRRR